MRPGIILLSILIVPWMQTVADAQGRRRANTRFAEMDTNNDGVVARSEWRGSEASFKVHDWNDDGVLSGDELRPGARRPARAGQPPDFDSPDREYVFLDWTAEGFVRLDHNRDRRITPDEWHFARDQFTRADRNGDGWLGRIEFLRGDNEEDDREDSFQNLDVNNDRRISRDEWHAARSRFDRLDQDGDGYLTRGEMAGSLDPPPDLFTSVDVNRDQSISRDEWHWSRQSFDDRDRNRDGRLTRPEFASEASANQSPAFKAGYDRGLVEGRAAGREDRERNQGWDLEGQRELEQADSGYESRFGLRAEYQAGYREAFRKGYREGYGPR
jgi:Ca2+-binding EF-hand superfamily protein